MASERPRFMMRNAALWVDEVSQIGQASEISFPELKMKTEKIFNAGQFVEIEVPMGYEAPETSFELTSFDPRMMGLWGLRIGSDTPLMATGALVDDDGTVHSSSAYLRGFIKELKIGQFKNGDVVKNSFAYCFRYFRLEIDAAPVIEIDPFGVSIGGVSQTAHLRRALML